MTLDEVTQEFAESFSRHERGSCSLYLISPQDVGGAFPDRLKAALEPGVATAFQLRVKDTSDHELARLADATEATHVGEETTHAD